jgi:predicted metalloprotease
MGLPIGRPVMVGGGAGCGLLVLILLAILLGIDPVQLLMDSGGTSVTVPSSAPMGSTTPSATDELADFVSVVLADTEDTWHALFAEQGYRYQEPTLVLFSGYVQSACGMAGAAMGPFYCPADGSVYIDLSFYDELRTRFRAPGDFAQAYVIAHEVGHHVQNLLGIARQVDAARRRSSATEANALSVRMELQADCLAGVWANHAHGTRHILEPGDIEEGLNAASAIGDDRIQRQSQGYVVPDSFTHGSSAQRVSWFKTGLSTGDMSACDTFTQLEP